MGSNLNIPHCTALQRFVHDAWNLFCAGKYYPQTLLFNTTQEPGNLRGYVPSTKIPFLPKKVVAGLLFPDTVVDFKEGTSLSG